MIEEKFTVGLEVDNVISFEETFISKPQNGMWFETDASSN
jgi:hypothetical protein